MKEMTIQLLLSKKAGANISFPPTTLNECG
jgi:hypothetical protein